ncbi:ribonuclease H family protein [Fructilactobacillus cliffordii]|uniref:Ribonuclease H n=1 Tax=Fructilactobacillus cliffordii TaxID=2940299 RepID=A0A9Q9E2K3_9LACO|nr:ribonuclease H family protein [Fructilactobacillus cliffordii]USS88852.1 ribonuclease H family protein [Fructilactobacillus cliffordii]
MTKTKKYYAVKKGRKPGIYQTWSEAKAQVEGFSGAQYQSFSTQMAAQQFLKQATSRSTKQPAEPTHSSLHSRPEIVVFTDGGSRNHGNVAGGHVKATDPAAWAYLIDWQGRQHSDSGGEWGVTNNKMEITALVKALQWLRVNQLQQRSVGVVSDSKYVLDAIQKGWLAGWKRRGWRRAAGELKNQELWRELDGLLAEFPHLQLAWTKGHATNQGNVYVDERLNQTMDQMEGN